MHHYPLIYLSQGKDSTAVYSYDNPDNLVVFVHGFTGEAMETWNNFEAILRDDVDFSSTDILFYGYESIKGQIYDQAMEFCRFMDINTSPNLVPGRGNHLPPYKKIIILAHSQGAIVSRYALLEAINLKRSWRECCKLLLFAPAHHGARIPNLVLSSIPGFFKIIGGLGLFFMPVLDDLRPESPVIKELNRITETYRGTTEEGLLTANVLHAHGDKVVHNIPFCFDQREYESPIRGENHSSVCKPKEQVYLTPYDI